MTKRQRDGLCLVRLILLLSHGCQAWITSTLKRQPRSRQSPTCRQQLYQDDDQQQHQASFPILPANMPASEEPPISLLETSLGDIMKSSYAATIESQSSNNKSNNNDVVASPSLSLAARYNITRPLDRLLLTANGNVQRLVSSYYDAPVRVIVKRFRKTTTTTPPTDAGRNESLSSSCCTTFERLVELQVFGATFCVASSTLDVMDANCLALIESGTVGLGQLFQYYQVLPEFTLLNAGVGSIYHDHDDDDDGNGAASGDIRCTLATAGLWREYRLDCQYISCRIHEQFCGNVWDLEERCE